MTKYHIPAKPYFSFQANNNTRWNYATWQMKVNLIYDMRKGLNDWLDDFINEERGDAVLTVLESSRNKDEFEHTENDDITSVSKAVNFNDTANLSNRENRYNNARKKNAFNVTRHYKDIYDNGNEDQKEEAESYFEKWKDKDIKALEAYNEINNVTESNADSELNQVDTSLNTSSVNLNKK